jgi:hypothetical protein
MGVNTINQLIEIVEDSEFRKHLDSQLNEYEKINSLAMDLLNKNGYDEKGISNFEKLRTYLMINMQTLTDKTASHISEMLIIGSNMGVIDAIKNINQYKEAEKDIVKLMESLLKFEENNIQELKSFL